MPVSLVVIEGDLALENHRLVFTSGATFVRQKISTRFQFFQGEWFLDRRQGVPYFRDVFVKNPNVDLIRAIFREVVASTPGVASVPSFSALYDAHARSLAFNFVAKLKGTGVVRVTPADRDFIVRAAA